MRTIYLSLVLMAACVFAGESDYIIGELKASGNIEPQPATRYMELLPGNSHLMPETDSELRPKGFYLRRRFWNGKAFEYILFHGRVNPEGCYQGLSFFRIEGMEPRQVLKLKFSAESNFNFYGDAEDVYFQDSLVLAPAVNLYYRSWARFCTAKKIDPPIGCLDIRSDPPGVEVRLDGKPLGVTPLFLSGLKTGLANLALNADGYLPVAQAVPVYPESTVQLHYPMFAMLAASTKIPDMTALLKENGKSPDEYAAREERVRGYLGIATNYRDSLGARLDSLYPPFIKGESETGSQANVRLTRYRHDRDEHRKAILTPFLNGVEKFNSALDSLRRMRERAECVPVPLDLPGDQLGMLEYDADLRVLPIQVDVRSQNLAFSYIGNLLLSPDENTRLRSRKKEVRIHMDYRRIPFAASNGQTYFFTLNHFRVVLDSAFSIDSAGSRFRYDKNYWKTPDSLAIEKRMKECKSDDHEIIREEKKSHWGWWMTGGLLAGGVAAGGAYYILLYDSHSSKETVYPVSVDPN